MDRRIPSDGGRQAQRPVGTDAPEVTYVDLSPDGLDCIPMLGDSHYRRLGGDAKPHVHPRTIEVLFCRKGYNLSFDYAGEAHPFRPGDALVSQPGVPHSLRPISGAFRSLSMYWLWFRLPPSGKSVLGLPLPESRWLTGRLRALPVRFFAGEQVERAFRRLWRLYGEAPRGAGRRLLLRDAVLHLLLRLAEAADNRRGERGHEALDAAIEEMRRSPAAAYTIDGLSRRLSMSVPKLIGEFRQRTGLPPHSFLIACRMDKAREALSQTRRSVTAVAQMLGFRSAQHFATQFRRETGMSPSAWRTKHTKDAR